VVLALSVLSAGAVWFFYRQGSLLYYGDAEAHLYIARRILDSRTPGFDQIGTVWLPLPHALLIPFAARDNLWKSGLAGAIPSAACFVIAGSFLFAAARRSFSSVAAACAAAGLFALNPNVLYLQSTPMSEAVFFAALMALLYFTVLLQQTRSWWAVVGAGVASLAGTLTRYEGWFLIPPVLGFVLLSGGKQRLAKAVVFGVIATLGPVAWLAHNWYYFGDALFFYRGPYAPKAIQGGKPYPGSGDWKLAALYFRTAVLDCVGPAVRWIAVAGVLAAIFRRAFWPLILLALPGFFYVWSMHSSGGTPIYVPDLWPNSYYNTRYGLVMLPIAAFAASALVTLVPERARAWAAAAVVLAGASPWLLDPSMERWITWKESQVNSEARREWTRQAVAYLAPRYHRGDGIFTSSSDLRAIYRTMGLPLREILTEDNEPQWLAAVARPDLFLREQWAVSMAGDSVQTAINRARRRGPNYNLVETIVVKNAPVIEIYRRSLQPDADSFH
jgi:hypothetical protein